MMMPGRNYKADNSYRYGFNGQEHSSELNDDSYTAEFWQYDGRTGRRWNIDPIIKIWESPYLCFSGNPLLFSDIKGNDPSSGPGPAPSYINHYLYNQAMTFAAIQVHKQVQTKMLGSKYFLQGLNSVRETATAFTKNSMNSGWFTGASDSYSASDFIYFAESFYLRMASAAHWWTKDFERLYNNVIFAKIPSGSSGSDFLTLVSANLVVDEKLDDLNEGAFSVVTSAIDAAMTIAGAAGMPIAPGRPSVRSTLRTSIRSKPVIPNRTQKEFDPEAFAEEIVAINKTTDGGGVLLNSTPSSAINSSFYYSTPAEQGAAIFRSISHGHMFANGNKRTAVAAFQSFAKQYGLKTVSQQEMMNVATRVATGEITDVSQIATMLIK